MLIFNPYHVTHKKMAGVKKRMSLLLTTCRDFAV